MYTSRGYRRSSRENQKVSRQGQIIQKKPAFQIDNNPVVIDAYKRYIMQGRTFIIGDRFQNSFYVNLADYSLTWTAETTIGNILSKFVNFAGVIFDQLTATGSYAISLELYSPNLEDSHAWWISKVSSNSRIAAAIDVIFVDRMGNVTFKQIGNEYWYYSNAWTSGTPSNLTLGYGGQTGDPIPITFGNPTQMKVDVNYYKIFQ